MICLKHYINGKYCDTSKNHKNLINPATQEVIGKIPIGIKEEVSLAIKSANKSFDTWSKTSSIKRSEYLNKIASSLERRKDSVAKDISLSVGKPLKEAYLDVDDAIACYLYYGKLAKEIDLQNEEIINLENASFNTIKRYEATGAVGLIVPWNFPTVTTAWKVAPALAAGCTVVLKPSSNCAIAEDVLSKIAIEIDLPKGVLNIVFGGSEVGQELAISEDLAKVSFTGSTRVGQEILSTSSPSLKNISLELGGKSSLIVCEDANIDEAAQLACNGLFFNNGQMCSATSRVLIHKNIYKEVLNSIKQKVESLKVSNPLSLDTDLGPLSSKMQFDTVLSYLKRAKEEGLLCLTGAKALEGNYISPTVYYDVPKKSVLWKEEIFGPILCVSSYENTKEAINAANDSDFGLAASVVSENENKAIKIAKELKAGIIWLNTDQIVLPQLSWGGYKKSSIGRELGLSGLQSFQELKHIILSKKA